jgi:aldose 1-epimerase
VATAPTGEQFTISNGPYAAVVTEVGATLRSLTFDGRDLINGFGVNDSVKGGRGQNLLPWPNRLRDGKYTFNGSEQQLPLSEPARHNASHGLARYVPWSVVELTDEHVTSQLRIFTQPGWPGVLEARITHRLGEEGLVVEVSAKNIGSTPLPFGYAAHPYLTVGEDTVDEVAVKVPARTFLEVDDRLLPAGLAPVDGTDNDLRDGTVIGSRNLDVAMTDIDRNLDGRWEVAVSLGERRTTLWGDETMGWVQVFTGGPYRNWSLAVEPMTCGPNAFNPGPTHDGLRILQPGESYRGSWGISGR